MMESSKDVGQPQPWLGRYRVPAATYRLQFNREFTFQDAFELTEYLHELGISDCYASPIFAARPDSSHGYDICDFSRLNPALGTQQDFDRWADRLRDLGMGLLLDVVPNHMGADPCNRWWRDVLENGESSRYAGWFDINWRPPDANLSGKVLLPILEDHYWKVLEKGKLRIVLEGDGFAIRYYEKTFPLSPESDAWLQEQILALCSQDGPPAEVLEGLKSLNRILANLKSARIAQEADVAQTRQHLREWQETQPESQATLDKALRRINGTPGVAASFDGLHALLQQQHYRLACWRLASEEINYRRFFDVSELVSLRMELPEVFESAHKLVFRLLKEGKATGLRIDHPDGLWNPLQYFRRLQESAGRACGMPSGSWQQTPPWAPPRGVAEEAGTTGHTQERGTTPLYVVVEKILTGEEALPQDWPVAGTTGYDFLNCLTGLFVNSANRAVLDELYCEFTGNRQDFQSSVYAGKKKVLRTSMRSELGDLTRLLRAIASRTRYGFDFSFSELQAALTEVLAAFPVYRTYITETTKAPTAAEKAFVSEAMQGARAASDAHNAAALDFIEGLLSLSPATDLDEAGHGLCRQFVMRFQQLTGPVMAKGLEDTACYNFNRLLSLNEVGGAPGRFGTEVEMFHQHNRLRAEHWPHSLLATATHDTKRGEDVRARLNVLSEIPEEWRQAVSKWSRLNAGKKTSLAGQPAPDANDEFLLYQTLLGAWVPEAETDSGLMAFRRRIEDYMSKAIREAKVHTSWTEPNAAYEEATRRFVDGLLTNTSANPFLDDFMLFHRKVAFFGLFNSLAQVVLKMTAPGVPDFYQGTELWDYNLVDPDNRRPVDYQTRRCLLSDLRKQLSRDPLDMSSVLRGLLQNYQTGQIKLYLIWRILEFRRGHREIFESGGYTPISAVGSKRDHLCAFARTSPEGVVITVVARLLLGLAKGAERGALEPDVWRDTLLAVPDGKPGSLYRNVLTEQVTAIREDGSGLPLREVLSVLPVAVLERLE